MKTSRSFESRRTLVLAGAIALAAAIGCSRTGPPPGPPAADGSSDVMVTPQVLPVCTAGDNAGAVARPEHVMTLRGQTGWFASPLVHDLDHDGRMELIAAYYSVFVYDDEGNLLDEADDGDGRVYAPHVVVDLDGDGITEVVAGRGSDVWAWEWINSELRVKRGWPADTTTAGEAPEVRGLAAADLDGDGRIEVVATTTQTQRSASGGAQVFVFGADGASYQPQGGHRPAWPRYNALRGAGNDADRNMQGHNGYGCYGLNVGLGNIDDDPQLEVVVTYDNHHIQVFDHDGVALDAAPWFTNRASDYAGQRMTWGQFIRWADPAVEADHYHDHTGEWPHPRSAEWLQWTASPPAVADLDLDGRSEIIGVPNIEMHEPYETQAYGLMVLEGAHGAGERSAMRKPGWEVLPRGGKPVEVDGWYPPAGVPAPAIVDVRDDPRPEIAVTLNDGYVHLFDADGQRLWRVDYMHGKTVMYASEVAVADLNQDGIPEVLFTTWGDPDDAASGFLVIVDANGGVLHDVALPGAGHNGNGNGAPAAPTVADLDGDGQLEIFVQTFDHGMDVFRVPSSGTNCVLWSTARGGALRTGQAHVER